MRADRTCRFSDIDQGSSEAWLGGPSLCAPPNMVQPSPDDGIHILAISLPGLDEQWLLLGRTCGLGKVRGRKLWTLVEANQLEIFPELI